MNMFEPYEKGDKAAKLIEKARETNAARDRIEENAGFVSPSEGPVFQQLRTVISAIVCGIEIGDWDCVAEGVAMLQQTEASIRPAPDPNRRGGLLVRPGFRARKRPS